MAAVAANCDVVIPEDVWGAPFEQLSEEYTVHAEPQLWSDRKALAQRLAGARALVVRNQTKVDAELLAAAPDLRIVARAGVGLDNIDVAAADAAGVVVVSPRGENAQSVAEYAVGTVLALVRDLVGHDRAVRAGRWDRHFGRELHGRTWGLLGAGATGMAVARLARGFGMTVLAYDPYVTRADDAVRLAPLEEVVAGSDVVSIHLPATEETVGLVGAGLLARMRPGAVLVNVGRGEVVDEHALADALEHGALAGAALDVRTAEPPTLGRLERLDNVLLTPHIAGLTEQSQARIMRALADDVRAVLSGGRAANAVGAATSAEVIS
ncbi:MAG: phosphoglycerate dehydrogenase [Actinophytocola sp.]|uniref:NAD(P)-dependent oxidoreductase n=1 Tax=Actinophytocola sp. TaxID=1872138 RepID=UPI00132C084F|nr:NAD(P)-dependent oxidoreductase [Actinophytocola sp.]MPZ82799.1 phosphoglycerate dehydrogenase [Actinophytocola sp.]